MLIRVSNILTATLLVIVSQVAWPVVPTPPDVSSRAYVLMDYHTGKVFASSNADQPMEPASLTKLMTVYVVFEELREGNIKLEDTVSISEKAWRTGGSRTFVEVGKRVSVEDLLKGSIIQSGNDASVALAEFVAGDETAFADLMNKTSERLGLKNTHFVNASGLPDANHFSTALDMAILAQALIRDFPELYQWHALKEFVFNGIVQHNRNKLLWRDDSVDGLKTGYTKSAGYCLVASAKRDEMRLISAVMGAKNVRTRTQESQALLTYGFRFFESHRIYAAKQPLTHVRVWKGEAQQMGIGVVSDLYVTVPRGQFKKLDAKMELVQTHMAPIAKGDPRGKVTVSLGEQVISERPLVALQSISEGPMWRRALDSVQLLFH